MGVAYFRLSPMPASRGAALGQRAAENNLVAERFDHSAGADKIEIPRRVGCITKEHCAGQMSVRHNELLVSTETRIGEYDRFSTGCAEKIAGREHLHPGDLKVGGVDAPVVLCVMSCEPLGKHARLVVSGLNQSVADAAMLGAFADGENVGGVAQ